MWSKISNVLKARADDEQVASSSTTVPHPGVVERVREQHPNMSIFASNSNQDRTLPVPSPPSSPTKNGRLGLFRRNTKHDNSSTASISKKVKSSLHINTNMNGSNMSLLPSSTTESGTNAYGSIRSLWRGRDIPSAQQINGEIAAQTADTRSPLQSEPPILPPLTPLDSQRISGGGSVRSILRDRKTPGTGQNVRFFSRDAYRVISPETSVENSTSDPPPSTFEQRLKDVSPDRSNTPNHESTKFHSALNSPNDVFSAPVSSPGGMFLDVNTDRSSAVFSTPSQDKSRHSMTSLLVPIPPPEIDLFDLSAAHEHNVQEIPLGVNGAIQDGAVEVDDFDRVIQKTDDKSPNVFSRPAFSGKENRQPSASSLSSTSVSTPNSSVNFNLSLGRRTGEKIFRSLTNAKEEPVPSVEGYALPPRSASSLDLYNAFSREGKNADKQGRPSLDSSTASSRSRAQSERVFSRPTQIVESTPPLSLTKKREVPEADINDMSATDVVLYDARDVESPDPFRADAKNYFTPDAGIPNSPPKPIQHTRTDSGTSGISAKSMSAASSRSARSSKSGISQASKISNSSHSRRLEEDDLILSLRTQLAYHQELSSQYEIDLSARDELVNILNQKLKNVEGENDKRTKMVRGWRKKIAELERACRTLEEQVDRSKQESFERSIMDEASGEALRQLHRQIKQLEREKSDVEKRELDTRAANEKLVQEIKKREDAERSLQAGIEDAKIQMEAMRAADQSMERGVEDVKSLMVKGEREYSEEMDRHRAAEFAWDEERAHLVAQLEHMETLQEQLNARENEILVLKKEVEVQWAGTEKLNARCEELEKDKEDGEREKEHLKNELTSLEKRMSEMEIEWTESENRRSEAEAELADVWLSREETEKERDQLREEVEQERTQVAELSSELEHLDEQFAQLQRERQAAIENVAHLEKLIEERNAEIDSFSQKLSSKEEEVESLRDELSSLRREHARLASEHDRTIAAVGGREADARKQIEESLRAQTEAQMEAKSLQDRVDTLQEEVEKLRRQVHELKKQSADQDVKLVQMERQHDQDKEDKLGLNIALDSKQQELELLKRKIGVCGTAGSTPAPPSRIGNRRESNAFATPIPTRPSSSLSDTGNKTLKQVGDTPSTIGKTTFGKSSRINAAMPPPPSAMKPSRLTDNVINGPPRRTSMSSSTSSTMSSSLTRSTSVRAAVNNIQANAAAATPGHRRVSSAAPSRSLASKAALMRSASASAADMSDASSTQDDKENSKPASGKSTPTRIARRGSVLGTPA